MKRVTHNGVRYEVELRPKVKVKNTHTGGFIKKYKNEIASLKDETITLVVNLTTHSPSYECWTLEEALRCLYSFKFDWLSADIYNSEGKLLRSINKQT